MKIAVVVHGRFHAFDLARELNNLGHDVTLFTNYPKFAVKPFGVSPDRVKNFVSHGIASRLAEKVRPQFLEAYLHKLFGRWVSREVNKRTWDVILFWSGIGEELLSKPITGLKVCHRSSSHIKTQARLLKEEEERTGIPVEQPSEWKIGRELREYELSDLVYVPSSFAAQSFIDEGFPPEKLRTIIPGVNTNSFRPSRQTVDERSQRILSGAPLRVLNVGTFSLRKGMFDMPQITESVDCEFRFVGPIAHDARGIARQIDDCEFIPPQLESDLPKQYAWGDMFILPTIEDGFAFVLSQASAACLPILTTPNSAGHDLIQDGNGWVLPIRSPQAFVEQLRWCDSHREELAEKVRALYTTFQPRDWSDVAREFVDIISRRLSS